LSEKRFAALFALVLATSGCVTDDVAPQDAMELPVHDHLSGDPLDHAEAESVHKNSGGCTQRWSLPGSTSAEGLSQRVAYHRATYCTGGAQSGAVDLGEYIREAFPGLINTAIAGRGIQIYNCRSVSGSGSRSIHSEGRALDVFIPTQGGRADNAQGDRIANWLVENAETIGVQMLIWDRTLWKPGRDGRCYTGSHPHHDHIHIELNWEAARRQTGFFTGETTAVPTPDSTENTNSTTDPVVTPAPWIGTACGSDSECDFTQSGLTGICLLDRNPDVGVCTIPCQGYCPDRSNYAGTFCASKHDLGVGSSGGTCLSKSSATNQHCTQGADMTEEQVNRWVGTSGARAVRHEVCAPHAIQTDRPPAGPAPQSICGDPSLELSDHGEPCDRPENTWRCACSRGFERSVSQVCRDGHWVSYQLSPRDCASCQGAYSSACEP
jgi:hypothetical protein